MAWGSEVDKYIELPSVKAERFEKWKRRGYEGGTTLETFFPVEVHVLKNQVNRTSEKADHGFPLIG